MDIHLLACTHNHMLTLRAHLSLLVFTYLLPTQTTTWLVNYLYNDTRSALHRTPTGLRTRSLASLLTYLPTYPPTYSLPYMPIYSLTRCRRKGTDLHVYIVTHLRAYRLPYILTR